MNIFVLDNDIKQNVEYYCDKHVLKMIVEYAQILSTAHRVLDGVKEVKEDLRSIGIKPKRTRYILEDGWMEAMLYKATHINHPSTKWAMQSNNNYTWLYCLLEALIEEYNFRFEKVHATSRLLEMLNTPPQNIPVGSKTQVTPVMPKEYIVEGDSVQSYRQYYLTKENIYKWTKRQMPCWITDVYLGFGLKQREIQLQIQIAKELGLEYTY